MIALLNQQQKVIAENFWYHERLKTFNLDKIYKLSFSAPVRLKDILNFIANPINKIRLATNKEIFSMLSQRCPLQDDEIIACLEPDLEIGDEVLVIRFDGLAIIPAFSLWDSRYVFPVCTF